MDSIKAVMVDTRSADRLALADVPAPVPTPAQAVVRVRAFSLNRGETRRASGAPDGHRPGWDIAGIVAQAAADGSGPALGSRVVGILPTAAWAELVAVPTYALAVLPDNVTFAEASTLPVAGLTALYGIEKRGSLTQRTVLIPGATGGVGLFGVQLAHLAGARVVAQIRRGEHEALIREAGADEVVIAPDASAAMKFGPYDVVLDGVGGSVFDSAVGQLAVEGVYVIYGTTGGAEGKIELNRFFLAGGASIYGFILFHEMIGHPAGRGLARLAQLVADGRLHPHIDVEAPWQEVGAVARRLLDRDLVGKAVLHIDG